MSALNDKFAHGYQDSLDRTFLQAIKMPHKVKNLPVSVQAHSISRWNTPSMNKASFLLNIAGILTLLTGFLLPSVIQALTLTVDQEQDFIQTMDSPEVTEIRRYIDACLSDQLGDPEDSYPCHRFGMEKGLTITEHPQSHVSGPFTVIWVQPFDYGGELYTVIFADPPHLIADIWVYLEGGTRPDMRGFMVRDWKDETRQFFVNDLGTDLTDTRFTR